MNPCGSKAIRYLHGFMQDVRRILSLYSGHALFLFCLVPCSVTTKFAIIRAKKFIFYFHCVQLYFVISIIILPLFIYTNRQAANIQLYAI